MQERNKTRQGQQQSLSCRVPIRFLSCSCRVMEHAAGPSWRDSARHGDTAASSCNVDAVSDPETPANVCLAETLDEA